MYSVSMSQQAGINAVLDEVVALSGQALVGGSCLMYLKKAKFRTSGFVIFSLTTQAVAYQAYTGEIK